MNLISTIIAGLMFSAAILTTVFSVDSNPSSDSRAANSKSANGSKQEAGDDRATDPDKILFEGWKDPDVALFISGRQHGYIEPCGCTGLDNQKGGVLRRHTFMKQLQAKNWP